MTTDELRATAELVVHGTTFDQMPDWMVAARRVATAYLAEHPADDAEDVTGDWLKSLGIVRACFEDKCYGYHHKKRCHTLNLRTDRGSVSNIDVFTRGDVRRLLTALGIPLAPKG
jgi:hypothetical protein